MMRAVRVVWMDSSTTSLGWADVTEYRRKVEVDTIVSVGFVVAEDETMLAITQSMTPLDRNPRRREDNLVNVQSTMAIPRVTVLSVDELFVEDAP